MDESNISTQYAKIRYLEDRDGGAVLRVWSRGLQQTVDSSFFLTRPLLALIMNLLKQKATSEDGDFGPNGDRTFLSWGNKTDRAMFVASIGNIIVGCCAIKRGSEEHDIASDDCTVYSVYRLSVDEDYRGQGLALSLMVRCEEWAKERGCTTIVLQTGNSIASKFYQKIGYTQSGLFGVQHSKEL